MADLNTTAAHSPGPPESRLTTDIGVDLRDLVDHRNFVQGSDTLEQVQHRFASIDANFMAVLDHDRVIGLCSRNEVGMQLGSQYGFALFGRSPVREHLVPGALIVPADRDWTGLLQQVFTRHDEVFNDDVVLVDLTGTLLGLITVPSLIRLQTRLLMQAIDQLRLQRSEISRRNRHMTAELLMAREVQRALQPTDFTDICSRVATNDRSVKIAAHYEPTGLVSGDFFEVLPIGDSTLSIIVADVMGHGVQAALVTAILRALVQEHVVLACDPAALLSAINCSLCAILADIHDPVFVTAFAASLETPTGTLTYSNAGHPFPIVLRASERLAVPVDCSQHLNGGVLGIYHGGVYHNAKTHLQSGDQLLIYTDGLFEVSGPEQEILGQDGLLSLAAANIGRSAESLMNELLKKSRSYSDKNGFSDDVCLLVIELD